MPESSPSPTAEHETLLLYLAKQRTGLKNAAYGLTEEQLRERPTASSLSVGGLLKHAAMTERQWASMMVGRPVQADARRYVEGFTPGDAETRASLVAGLDAVAAETEAGARSITDLGVKVMLPEAPWFPQDPTGFSVRWILLHVIEELARHAGHADIIREQLDGATGPALMAAVEGWPETDWVKPWRPAPDAARPGPR